MDVPVEPADRDRRRASRDRRRGLHDRRHFWPRMVGPTGIGRVVRWFTGPWSSANGLTWLRLLVLFLIVRWGVLTVYSIPSASMEPTLNGDTSWFSRDRVAINKLAYGPRYPFTAQRIVRTGAPERWDVVVFNSPQPTDEGDVLIKRVVGLPGEVVHVVRDGVYIAGELLSVPDDLAGKLRYTPRLEATPEYVNRLALSWAKATIIPAEILKNTTPARYRLQEDLVKLAGEIRNVEVAALGPARAAELVQGSVAPESLTLIRKWREDFLRRAGAPRYGVSSSLDTTLVPRGHYFVLGDNGPESIDSRIFGFVPHENLVGRAFAIVTPFSRVRDISGFMQEPRGRLIFFGGLALVLVWELVPGLIAFSWTLRGAIPALGLKRGDRVLVNRIVYGPRLPLTHHRLVWWSTPKPGDVVCFLMSHAGNGFDVYFGEVLSIDRAQGWRAIVRGPGDAEQRGLALTRRDVVGRVRVVWAPRGRRGRVRPGARVESTGADRLH